MFVNYNRCYELKHNTPKLDLDLNTLEETNVLEDLEKLSKYTIERMNDLYTKTNDDQYKYDTWPYNEKNLDKTDLPSVKKFLIEHWKLLFNTSRFDELYDDLKKEHLAWVRLLKEDNTSLHKVVRGPFGDVSIGGRVTLIFGNGDVTLPLISSGYHHGLTEQEIRIGSIMIDNEFVELAKVTDKQWKNIMKTDLRYAYNQATLEYSLKHNIPFCLISRSDQIRHIINTNKTIQSAIPIQCSYHQNVLNNNVSSIGILEKICGLRYDPEIKKMEFLCKSNDSPNFEEIVLDENAETLIKTLYLLMDYENLTFSLDMPTKFIGKGKFLKTLNGDEKHPLLNSLWGRILFEADYVLKWILLGHQLVQHDTKKDYYFSTLTAPSIPDYLELLQNLWTNSDNKSMRMWIELNDSLFLEENEIVLFDTSMPVIKMNMIQINKESKSGFSDVDISLPDVYKQILIFANQHYGHLMKEYKALENMAHLGRLFGMIKYAKEKNWLPPIEELIDDDFKKNHYEQCKQESTIHFEKYHFSNSAQNSFKFGGINIYSNLGSFLTKTESTSGYMLDTLQKQNGLRLLPAISPQFTHLQKNIYVSRYTEPISQEHVDTDYRSTIVYQAAGLIPIVSGFVDLYDSFHYFMEGEYGYAACHLAFALVEFTGIGSTMKVAAKVGNKIWTSTVMIKPRHIKPSKVNEKTIIHYRSLKTGDSGHYTVKTNFKNAANQNKIHPLVNTGYSKKPVALNKNRAPHANQNRPMESKELVAINRNQKINEKINLDLVHDAKDLTKNILEDIKEIQKDMAEKAVYERLTNYYGPGDWERVFYKGKLDITDKDTHLISWYREKNNNLNVEFNIQTIA